MHGGSKVFPTLSTEARGACHNPFDCEHNRGGRSSATPKQRSMQPVLDLGYTDHRSRRSQGLMAAAAVAWDAAVVSEWTWDQVLLLG